MKQQLNKLDQNNNVEELWKQTEDSIVKTPELSIGREKKTKIESDLTKNARKIYRTDKRNKRLLFNKEQ